MLFSICKGGHTLLSIREFQLYIVKHEKCIVGPSFHDTIVC